MSQDEFTKLFKYMQTEFKKIDKRFDATATKKQVDDLTNTVDGLTKLIVDYNQEMLMIAHKIDRLEKWINQIAAKTGVRLEY